MVCGLRLAGRAAGEGGQRAGGCAAAAGVRGAQAGVRGLNQRGWPRAGGREAVSAAVTVIAWCGPGRVRAVSAVGRG